MREDEERTVLRGDEIISKCDPRLEFRGQLDSLLAQAVLNCAYAEHYGYTNITLGAQEIVRVTKELVRAEAKGQAPEIASIMGMSLDEIREASYHPKTELGLDHYYPDEHIDLMSAHLNMLRTDIRQAERACCCIDDDSKEMKAMRLILNRLSSAAYVLMLECHAEHS